MPQSRKESLATGFAHVDRCGDVGAFQGCLSLLDSLPYFQWYKAESFRLLALRPGMAVLDAGCGLGEDVCRMARLVAPGGRVSGMDASAAMIGEARRRAGNAGCDALFRVADARALPFCEASFDRCRIDRTLQHIAEPEKALRELFRVVRPGGLVLAYDNDWGSFSLSSENPELTLAVEQAWARSFTNPWIGRHLGLFFKRAGFVSIEVFPSVSLIGDFVTADRVYGISGTLEALLAAGAAEPDEVRCWREELLAQSASGVFRAALCAYMVVGKKPA